VNPFKRLSCDHSGSLWGKGQQIGTERKGSRCGTNTGRRKKKSLSKKKSERSKKEMRTGAQPGTYRIKAM